MRFHTWFQEAAQNLVAMGINGRSMMSWAIAQQQCLGRFLDIIGQDPSVVKSNGLWVDIFRIIFYLFEEYFINSSKVISNFCKVLYFNCLILKINQFIYNCAKHCIYCHWLFGYMQCYSYLLYTLFLPTKFELVVWTLYNINIFTW